MTDKQDAGTNFVWSKIGKDLQRLDKDRMLAIAHQKPDYMLSVMANIDGLKIIEKIFESGKSFPELTKEIEKMIFELNHKDNMFREIADMLRHSRDMLSMGSTITGEIKRDNLPMRIDYDE